MFECQPETRATPVTGYRKTGNNLLCLCYHMQKSCQLIKMFDYFQFYSVPRKDLNFGFLVNSL
jgi:hypothetical protein